jgi:hypothetical protein
MVEQVDRASEYLRVREHYRGLTDGELLALAGQSLELTDVAQQALASELSSRGLKPEADEPPAPSRPQPPVDIRDPADPNYDEDKLLVTIRTVWSLADALQLQNLLDTAGIPFYIGPEKAAGVESVTSNFADGLDFKIMSIGMPWARLAMKNYAPADDRAQEPEEELDEESVRCPKCRSCEVVLEETEPVQEGTSPQRFKWTCDECGFHWEDDGVEEFSRKYD